MIFCAIGRIWTEVASLFRRRPRGSRRTTRPGQPASEWDYSHQTESLSAHYVRELVRLREQRRMQHMEQLYQQTLEQNEQDHPEPEEQEAEHHEAVAQGVASVRAAKRPRHLSPIREEDMEINRELSGP